MTEAKTFENTANTLLAAEIHQLIANSTLTGKELLIQQILESSILRDRFLKARQQNVKQAVQMVLEAQAYRQKYELDTILTRPFPKVNIVRANYVCGWHKTDLFGNPVYIDRVGKLNVDNLQREVTIDGVLFSHHHANEYLTRMIHRKETNDPGKITSIIDLNGLSYKQISKTMLSFLSATTKADQLLFPEMLTVCIVINAPTLFSIIWKCLQPVLEERTKKKIIVCRDSGLSTLTKYIALENLPKFLGGTCDCGDGDCINNSAYIKEYLAYITSSSTST